MKHAKRLVAILMAILLMLPTVLASAESTKTEEIVDMLNASDLLTSLGGTATLEDDVIWIEYMTENETYSNVTFPFDGTVIEYTMDDVTDYDGAMDALNRFVGILQMLYTALELNGYTEDEVMEYFLSEDVDPSMEVNGFEIKEAGDALSFEGDDEDDFLTLLPMSIKVDVAKANLNTPDDDPFEPTGTTVQDVVDYLAADEDFTSFLWDDGTLLYETTIYIDDDTVVIDRTDYEQDYHTVWFDCVDDVLTFEPYEMTDFYDAQYVSNAEMWAMIILQTALKANGYTAEEIAAYFASEDNHPTMEVNGFEIEETGEAQTFEGDYTMTVTPVSVVIDLAKANLSDAEPDPESEAERTIEADDESDVAKDVTPIGETENTALNGETENAALNGETENTASTDPVGSPDTGDATPVAAIALLLISLAALPLIKSKKSAE